jgi:site-specific DNA-methyltransferase (adenine-specific)
MARKPLAEKTVAENVLKYGTGGINIDDSRVATADTYSDPNGAGGNGFPGGVGREPDGSRIEAVESSALGRFPANLIHDNSEEVGGCFPNDEGRFFKSIIYSAKASKRDRGVGNNHPTVKPVALMEYLITMVSTPGATILDPFAGSGTTLVAAKQAGRNAIGIELSPEYAAIAERRVAGVPKMYLGLFD